MYLSSTEMSQLRTEEDSFDCEEERREKGDISDPQGKGGGEEGGRTEK